MSAYIVPDNQVLLIAVHYHKTTSRGSYFYLEEIESLANTLLTENYFSVNYRYNETGTETVEPTLITFEHFEKLEKAYTPIQVIKFCQNHQYQSCEHPGWDKSQAKKISESVLNTMISKLPGYDKAAWGMPESL